MSYKKIYAKYLGVVKASLPYSAFSSRHDTRTRYVFFLPFQNLFSKPLRFLTLYLIRYNIHQHDHHVAKNTTLAKIAVGRE